MESKDGQNVEGGSMKCKKHPDYKAKLYPRSGCPECFAIWIGKGPGLKEKAKQAVKEKVDTSIEEVKGCLKKRP